MRDDTLVCGSALAIGNNRTRRNGCWRYGLQHLYQKRWWWHVFISIAIIYPWCTCIHHLASHHISLQEQIVTSKIVHQLHLAPCSMVCIPDILLDKHILCIRYFPCRLLLFAATYQHYLVLDGKTWDNEWWETCKKHGPYKVSYSYTYYIYVVNQKFVPDRYSNLLRHL